MDTLRSSEIKHHEKECEKGLIYCPQLICKEKINLKKLAEHIEANHDKFVKNGSGWFTVLPESYDKSITWIPSELKLKVL
jgi:hypothetical protein